MFSKKPSVTSTAIDTEDTLNNLLIASHAGNLVKVKNIIKQLELRESHLINGRNIAGNTPLHLAVTQGHIEIVRFLVSNGADIFRFSNHQSNPFDEACLRVRSIVNEKESGQLLNNFEEILKIFLAKGFDLNATAGKSKSHLGNLAHAGALDAMKILVKHGASIDIRDQFGFTPLHCAAIKGHFHKEQLEVAKWLIDMGADVHARTYKGDTALVFAVESDHQAMVNLLRPKLNIGVRRNAKF